MPAMHLRDGMPTDPSRKVAIVERHVATSARIYLRSFFFNRSSIFTRGCPKGRHKAFHNVAQLASLRALHRGWSALSLVVLQLRPYGEL
jgi:hypothetical protein